MESKDYDEQIAKHCAKIHNEMKHDVFLVKATAVLLFILGFLLGALMF